MIVLLIFLFLLPPQSRASTDWVGNGGNLIECQNPYNLMLLDYYEGQHRRNLTIDLGTSDSVDEKVLFVLNRLEKINPSRAQTYKTWFRVFYKEVEFFQGYKFGPIPDTGPLIIPNNCEITQIGAQRPDNQIMPGDSRYLINETLWKQTNYESRAGLILHELIYREGINAQQTTSTRVRYFNQIISSREFESYDSLKILKLIQTVGFRYVDYYGIPIDLENARYYQSGAVRTAYAKGGEFIQGQKKMSLKNEWVVFNEDGTIQSIQKRESFFPASRSAKYFYYRDNDFSLFPNWISRRDP